MWNGRIYVGYRRNKGNKLRGIFHKYEYTVYVYLYAVCMSWLLHLPTDSKISSNKTELRYLDRRGRNYCSWIFDRGLSLRFPYTAGCLRTDRKHETDPSIWVCPARAMFVNGEDQHPLEIPIWLMQFCCETYFLWDPLNEKVRTILSSTLSFKKILRLEASLTSQYLRLQIKFTLLY